MNGEKESEPFLAFVCGGKSCPKGGDHEWDGEWALWDDPGGGGGGSATCSKCGLARIDYDMMNCEE